VPLMHVLAHHCAQRGASRTHSLNLECVSLAWTTPCDQFANIRHSTTTTPQRAYTPLPHVRCIAVSRHDNRRQLIWHPIETTQCAHPAPLSAPASATLAQLPGGPNQTECTSEIRAASPLQHTRVVTPRMTVTTAPSFFKPNLVEGGVVKSYIIDSAHS
jgi:hypothetical protein